MGFSTSKIVYSVEVPGQPEPKSQTRIRRHPDSLNGLQSYPEEGLQTIQAMALNTFKNYPQKNALGSIIQQKEVDQNGNTKTFKKIVYLSYRQTQIKVKGLGNSIIEMGLAPQIEDVPGMKMKFVGIFSKNRYQWMIVDYACVLYGFVTVPIYDTLGIQNISYILQHTKLQNCFCSKQAIQVLLKTKSLGSLKHIISFDPLDQNILSQLAEKGLKVHFLDQLITNGKSFDNPYSIVKPNDVLTFCYTSGTTGTPKGAMLTHRNFTSFCAVMMKHKDIHIEQNQRYLSYLPLPHILERMLIFAVLFKSAVSIFYSGDVLKIKQDLEIAKPTFFCSVPRLYNRFYQGINQKFNQITGVRRAVLNKAISTKLYNNMTNGGYTHKVYDKLIFRKTKAVFGGCVKAMISGSAPLLPDIHRFMKIVSCAPVLEGYGQTQSTGASFATEGNDPTTGHVGGPTANVQYKLKDIPQMGYTHLDKDQQGRICPRGQICMRGPGIFKGYYKDIEKTKQALDEDGWLHSGDVGMIRPDNGALVIIDRKKNIFKLQQGEYVAAEKVESVYTSCGNISEMFLYGDAKESYAIGIMVPNKNFIQEIGKRLDISGSFEQLCQNREVRKEALNIMNKQVKKQGLLGFEQAKNIYLDPNPFLSKGVITSTLKLQRFEAKKLYKQILQNLYKEGPLN